MSQAFDATSLDQIRALNLASQPAGHPAKRGQHRKHHGCARAIFRVAPDIPAALRHGIFAHPRDFEAYVRFSNGRVIDDRRADAHGMAIKLLGVEGEKLLDGRLHECAQDFVLVDSETFFTGDPTQYVRINRAMMGKGFTRFAAWLELLLRPCLITRIMRFVSKRPRSPYQCSYFSTVPSSLGPHIVKYAVLPRSPITPGPADGPNGLAKALQERLAKSGIAFAFALDIQTDPERQPVEDPSVAWSVGGAHRVVVAEVILLPQELDPTAAIAENLQFSPWHALEAHRPLGFINTARGLVYRDMAKLRHSRNGLKPLENSEAPQAYVGHAKRDAA